jgi:hypothetical protein
MVVNVTRTVEIVEELLSGVDKSYTVATTALPSNSN